jgi:hypothetical protein
MRYFKLLSFTFLLTISCIEGPTGPQGPVGPQGEPGIQGPAGKNGTDAVNKTYETTGKFSDIEPITINDSTLRIIIVQDKEIENSVFTVLYVKNNDASIAPIAGENTLENDMAGKVLGDRLQVHYYTNAVMLIVSKKLYNFLLISKYTYRLITFTE